MSRPIYRSPWRVDVTVRPGIDVPIAQSALARDVAAALDAAGAPGPASVGLILSDDEELASLNQVHMGTSGATDVLSFPLLPPAAFPPHEGGPADAATGSPGARPHLGDIIVSVERAIEQAGGGQGGQTGDVRWQPADELRLLVTHGALHLCGWDHAEPVEESAMRALEARLLGRV
jgi:probable rRNA maturation factor